MEPNEILKRPYARILVPDSDGKFTAEILEFPNCIAIGDTQAEALSNLEETAADWIEAAIAQGQDIPDPMDSAEFSGKLVLRMPAGLHKRAAMCAEREGVSLNQFITTGLAEAVGERARPLVATIYPQLQANLSLNVGLLAQSGVVQSPVWQPPSLTASSSDHPVALAQILRKPTVCLT